jgi:hypothetical protein
MRCSVRGLASPVSDLVSRSGRRWLAGLDLAPVPRQAIDGFLFVLDAIDLQVKLCEREIRRRVREFPDARRLAQFLALDASLHY